MNRISCYKPKTKKKCQIENKNKKKLHSYNNNIIRLVYLSINARLNSKLINGCAVFLFRCLVFEFGRDVSTHTTNIICMDIHFKYNLR